MDTTELTYPVFEANQVLTNAHLNDLFEYLDEQQRLTRANLIGIGVVCGLEVERAGPGTVRLSRGCGITSQGYLIVEPVDLDLVSVRPYQLPVDDPLPPGGPYAPFVQPGTNPPSQYDLWEVFPDDDVPGAQPIASSGLVLDDKALVLFLELRRDGLRNCSPNNCDDRGSQVTSTVRRLLVDVDDVDAILAAAPSVPPTTSDVEVRLDLPDLRLPRFDVPNSGPVDAEEILAGFHAAFRGPKLVAAFAGALQQLYQTFRPLVVDDHPTDPFAGFWKRFGFLDGMPVTTAQVRFLQYYWDLFADLSDAYDEVRWAGTELMCACCPPEGAFPRHLVAGVLAPVGPHGDRRRTRFTASPATGDCVRRSASFRMLFSRLVGMARSFTDTPSLPAPAKAGPDRQIRITPTRRGSVALGERAIPYYYEHDAPGGPLYRTWDPVKAERRREHHNLGYRADEYVPAAPSFVADPLRFDLDPSDFLRIEGHLGKDVRDVIATLLTLRDERRLPIEVVAVRAGAFDESIEIDLDEEECRFEDLETLYEALTSELTCFLGKQVQYFYDLPSGKLTDVVAVPPSFGILRDIAPDYRVQPGTIGRVIEANLAWRPGETFVGFAGTPEAEMTARERLVERRDAVRIDDLVVDERVPQPTDAVVVDRDTATPDTVLEGRAAELSREAAARAELLRRAGRLPGDNIGTVGSAAGRLDTTGRVVGVEADALATPGRVVGAGADALAASGRLIDATGAVFVPPEVAAPVGPSATDDPDVAYHIFALTNAMKELAAVVPGSVVSLDAAAFGERYARLVATAEQFDAARRKAEFDRPGLSDRIDDIVFRCRLDPLEALAAEYRRRLRDVKQARFFSHYSQHHPGLQHGAGVPLGGTFVVVYHEPPRRRRPGRGAADLGLAEAAVAEAAVAAPFERAAGLRDAAFGLGRADPVDDALAAIRLKPEIAVDPDVGELFRALTGERLVPKVLAPGVASKIFATAVNELPAGAVVADFFLPYQCCSSCSPIQYTLPPIRLRMDVAVGCTGANGAEVTVTVDGASGAVSVQLDGGNFRPLEGSITVAPGEHTIVARDDAGAETPTTTFVVPPALTTSEPEVTVNEANRTYQVGFEISGGNPPYAVDVGTVADGVYQSPVLAGGQALHVVVRDATRCTVEVDVDAPVDPCTLPCGGRAERRGHRFWFPTARPNVPVSEYATAVEVFRISDDAGLVIDLVDPVTEILNSRRSPIRASDFEAVVERWLAAINELIADQVDSPDWVRLEFEPGDDLATFGTLWIDRLACLRVDVVLQVDYVQGGDQRVVVTQYDPAGSVVATEDSKVRIPPFDGSVSDKCDGGEPEPICDGAEFDVEVAHELLDGGVQLVAKDAAGTAVIFLWEVSGASPSLANGERVRVEFGDRRVAPVATLTVFDRRGCSFRIVHEIPLG